MIESMFGGLLEFLLLYWIHSSVIIGAVLLSLYFNLLQADRLGEWVLKGALLMGVITALIQMNVPPIDTLQMPQRLGPSEAHPNPSVKPSMPPRPENNRLIQKKIDEVANSQAPVEIQAAQRLNNNQWVFHITWSHWFLGLWILGISLFLCHKSLQLHRLRQLLQDRSAVQSESTLKLWQALLETTGMKTSTRLSESPVIASPIALPQGEVVLPLAFGKERPQSHVQAALAHELAHLKRKDGIWLWIHAVLAVVFFFQPLNRTLGRKINQLAEQRSDALAAQWTGEPRALAEALAAVAHNQFYSTQWVSAMKSNQMNLVTRIEHLVKQTSNKTPRLILLCAGITLLAVMTYSPGFVIEYASASGQYNRVSVEDDGHITTLKISSKEDGRVLKLTAELTGEIKFNPDETEITAFPEDSEFDLRVEQGGIKRRLEIDSHGNDVVYTFHVDGDEQPYNAEAKQWFAQILPEVFRITGLDAQARVKRLYDHGGTARVLDEVALIKSDYVAKVYLIELFQTAALTDRELMRSIGLFASIESDYEQSQVSKALLSHQDFQSDQVWLAWLESTDSIQSDYELAQTLKKAIEYMPEQEHLQEVFFDAAKGIQSDYEMTQLFGVYVEKQGSNNINMAWLLEAAHQINSDFELASLLKKLSIENGSAPFAAFLNLSTEISSDFEMKQVYSAWLNEALSAAETIELIEVAQANIGSDFELASLLHEILDRKPEHTGVLQAVKSATQSLGSQFERQKMADRLLHLM